MKFYHEGLGHPTASRLLQKIRQKYYWININEDIINYCKNCKHCKLRKADYRVSHISMSRYTGVKRAFQRVHIDLVGPLTKTNSGYEYILVIKDSLTQWI